MSHSNSSNFPAATAAKNSLEITVQDVQVFHSGHVLAEMNINFSLGPDLWFVFEGVRLVLAKNGTFYVQMPQRLADGWHDVFVASSTLRQLISHAVMTAVRKAESNIERGLDKRKAEGGRHVGND